MTSTPGLSAVFDGVALALYAACQVVLLGYSAHRWWMLAGPGGDTGGIRQAPGRPPWWRPGDEPRVLVQLPIYDEPVVVSRLVAAAVALDWPRDRLEIQLLDDSSDAAAAVGARAVAEARTAGVTTHHVRRAHRHGFKAGALGAGLAASDAEFVAVFDADFVPPANFLRRTLPHFRDANLGLVQARWGHLNRDANLLTRAQAVMLDAHQLVEHAWRQGAGRFLNFNGTAGVWRRTCIDSAGGWSHETLTEDLDLSYRAQLAGWRFMFDPTLVVPAELPENMRAFRSQQHRWAKGALQTARKLLPRLSRAPLPWHIKQEAFVHLTANVTYPLLLGLEVLLVPVLFAARPHPTAWVLALNIAVLVIGTLPVAIFLARGQRLANRRGVRVLVDVLGALLLCGGLSWHLACAVVEGLSGATGEFVRTPKTGSGTRQALRHTGARYASEWVRPVWEGAPELALAVLFTLAASWAACSGWPTAAPYMLLLSAGLAWVGLATRHQPRLGARAAEYDIRAS